MTTPQKHALLIGSSFGGLRGTDNDVKTMTEVLQARGFHVGDEHFVKVLSGKAANRENILEAWRGLISKISTDDVVVIYYSGHGGLIEPDPCQDMYKNSPHIQFIVPYDFDLTLRHWRGISEGELSLLLRQTTDRTHNVTYILDCCHSARLGRDVTEGFTAEPKMLSIPNSKSCYPDLVKALDSLRDAGGLHVAERGDISTNPYAVRIAAAADDETAWEYQVTGQNATGLLTKNLAAAIKGAGEYIAWRDIMLEVGILVRNDYEKGRQNPRSAGPDDRTPFSINTKPTGAFLATMSYDDEGAVILMKGGQIHGVQTGDTFMFTPFRTQDQDVAAIVKARVCEVKAFAAALALDPASSNVSHGDREAFGLAVPDKPRSRWPIAVSGEATDVEGTEIINTRLDQSAIFRRCQPDHEPVLRLENTGGRLILYSNQGLELASERFAPDDLQNVIDRLFAAAKTFFQAEHVLSLQSANAQGYEALSANVEIELGLVRNRQKEAIRSTSSPTESPLAFAEKDKFYITLQNKGADQVYVNVLNVDAIGKINIISGDWERGIRLPAGRFELLAENPLPMKGIQLDWPPGVPRDVHVDESFVFIITDVELDLRNLVNPFSTGHVGRSTTGGANRDKKDIRYQVERIRYSLKPSSTT
ncbi:peptidase c14 caspase catalytic subunit p20 [Colletotrichum plurivorum]|uniref:Peptidase c14 caspase catalytic subunit p20 n=1 Tax=Colletotrichum plurivorum TaxID=2175906 RepID=A0A8H6JR60_9PEZI|nr:peptidase c14 caspase catalytic subunit p20 [Colletotrichum plurivorum]